MKAIIAVPAIAALCYRAYSHKSLTAVGTAVAAVTASVHAYHPWNLPFALLAVFFLAGTRVTKVKKEVKERLTIQSSGSSGGEGPRTHIQVLANSGVASVLILLHAYKLRHEAEHPSGIYCYPWRGDLLVVGIIANYAAVAADTFSSELGILSKSSPRLITSLTLRKVPPGTNGGVTIWGLAAGLLGSIIMVTTALIFVPFCGTNPVSTPVGAQVPLNGLAGGHGWGAKEKQYFSWGMALWGALGSVLDSFLGGWLQQSVVDTRTGRIVEGEGGKRVLVSGNGPNSMHFKKRAEVKAALLHGDGRDAIAELPAEEAVEEELNRKMGSPDRTSRSLGQSGKTAAEKHATRVAESGMAVLDNNEVNFLMALTMSVGAMAVAGWVWEIPLQSILPL